MRNIVSSQRWTLAAASSVSLALALIAAPPAAATDGYFGSGYGAQAKGLGGGVIAYPQDSLALAVNPAAASELGNRWDAGLQVFTPDRKAAYRGTALDASYNGNAQSTAYIPEAGYVRQINDQWSAGVALYGNGGMITSYRSNPFARFGATGGGGVELQQLFISPTLAYRFAPGQSLGVSLNVAGQTFRARGIGPFAGFSAAPANFTNKGVDTEFGYGVRLGYLGRVSSRLSVGAFWQSKTSFDAFHRYSGLFAEQGGFDAPSTYGVGAAYKATKALDLVAEWRRIDYSQVKAVGNSVAALFAGHPFGSNEGPGFGWRDINVIKLGAAYRLSPAWTLRAGYDHAENPVPANQTLLNILAPAVVTNHYAVGATWARPSGLQFTGYAEVAPRHTVHGSGSIPPAFGGGEADISLGETVFGLSVGWKH